MSQEKKTIHTLSGRVISAKTDKTITVQIDRVIPHPLYGKYIRRSSTLLAHDEKNESRDGDVVVVAACRPISKRKVWTLDRILDRAK